MIPVFDGHNDFLQRVVAGGTDIWLKGDGTGHLDLPRARAGGLVGGFFAIWIPAPQGPNDAAAAALMENPPFAMPLPDEISFAQALPHAFAQAAALKALERTGTLDIVTSASGLRRAVAAGPHQRGIAVGAAAACGGWHPRATPARVAAGGGRGRYDGPQIGG